MPYRFYQYNGNPEYLIKYYQTFLKHLKFLEGKINNKGLCEHGLTDWAGPFETREGPVPLEFVCTVLLIKFYRITVIAAKLLNDSENLNILQTKEENLTKLFKSYYINNDGTCNIFEQTALCLIIANGLHDNLEPLKKQLKEHLILKNYHFSVGMLGMQYLFPALDICGMQDEGYKILTASGVPSYRWWFDNGATSLHEFFHETQSCNHHMYSCPISWFYNTILGIRHYNTPESEHKLTLNPCFVKGLEFAYCSFKTKFGTIRVDWQRNGKSVTLYADIPDNLEIKLKVNHYNMNGESEFMLKSGRNELKFYEN